ncbi:hypothetical protein SERLA73DRAFT_45829 [Serpula lacrymans var. lacrymans S7.3]|uniref:Uncharacterized protein n=1 Tax=Serpula lacrymans var. lacrymans (strain S7.3) TaxID=936435 RepID=F8PKZ0_SERL3|nr:hypothetical protein SERLA73DRAFT_45829 [Serpula lacrymans var. lacrymans S7.3]
MNSINASTGFSPFHLHIGRFPRLLPPFILPDEHNADTHNTANFLSKWELDVAEAQDNLLAAKTSQATSADKHCAPNPAYNVSDLVMLSTHNQRCYYI